MAALLTCVVTMLDWHSQLLGPIPRGYCFLIEMVRYSVTLRVFRPLGWYTGYPRKKGIFSLGSLLDTKQKKKQCFYIIIMTQKVIRGICLCKSLRRILAFIQTKCLINRQFDPNPSSLGFRFKIQPLHSVEFNHSINRVHDRVPSFKIWNFK